MTQSYCTMIIWIKIKLGDLWFDFEMHDHYIQLKRDYEMSGRGVFNHSWNEGPENRGQNQKEYYTS